ncbi:hypothetical protein VTJ04DRAFT_4951 [Mycothermus thermophilus]|uniref:uncharacterized protein n=1 Tax=Humicola insolens TaxID=85995 RepID=UPI0037420BBC
MRALRTSALSWPSLDAAVHDLNDRVVSSISSLKLDGGDKPSVPQLNLPNHLSSHIPQTSPQDSPRLQK